MEQLEFLLSGPVKSSKVRADTIASGRFGDRLERTQTQALGGSPVAPGVARQSIGCGCLGRSLE